jgi:cyclopropane fatty-acyl-phospholipid synthase-like methyltransferase
MDPREQTEFFYEMFDASLPRLGAGNEACTKKALNTILAAMSQGTGGPILRPARILDIGCGNGPQTICLAQHTDGSILATDNHQPVLDELVRRAKAAGVAGKIRVSLRDMRTLSKDDGPFDLIWSEGAIFIVGFREGLAAWHSLLTPGGGLAVSEMAWLRSDPPQECRQFFAEVYPAMTSIAANLATIEACGYHVIEHLIEPESAWWDWFYGPLEARLRLLRKRYAANAERLAIIDSIQKEIDIYRKYSAYYGNVFYLMRRR